MLASDFTPPSASKYTDHPKNRILNINGLNYDTLSKALCFVSYQAFNWGYLQVGGYKVSDKYGILLYSSICSPQDSSVMLFPGAMEISDIVPIVKCYLENYKAKCALDNSRLFVPGQYWGWRVYYDKALEKEGENSILCAVKAELF